ncbi:MAG TPA: hypothetical protein VFR29_01500 [Steroidobacteraceae bacterium]|nr:hypothetical protein [Steroidobacteraceae bacterium]
MLTRVCWLIALTGLLWGYSTLTLSSDDEFNAIEYLGTTIPLNRMYADFDAYKDDPDNLPEDQIPRIAELVRSAPVPRAFASRKKAFSYLSNLMFPGYGFSAHQLDKTLALFSIEVPQMEQDRWVTLVPEKGQWIVVDDFTWPVADGYIDSAEYRNGHVEYFDHKGTLIREKLPHGPN